MGINSIAALWGFAEATLFFIVPDVWLSIVGRKKLKVGLLACLYSLIGAVTGGVILFLWGSSDFTMATEVIEKVPAVSSGMLLRVHAELTEQGVLAILLGPLSATPYKLYAIQAANTGVGIWVFILISLPARLIRFILVTIFCHYALKALIKLGIKIHSLVTLGGGWAIFYLYYFHIMAN